MVRLKQEAKKLNDSSFFLSLLITFFEERNHNVFFQPQETFFSKHERKIISSSLQIHSSQYHIMTVNFVLIKFLIIFKMTFDENVTVKSDLHVFYEEVREVYRCY